MLDAHRIFLEQRLSSHELPHRTVVYRQARLTEVVTEVLDKYSLHRPAMCQTHEVSKFMQVLPHDHNHKNESWKFTAQSLFDRDKLFKVAHHAFKTRTYANALVGLGVRTINRNVEAIKAAGHAPLGAPFVQERQIRVGGDGDIPPDGVSNHIKKAWVHHRFAQPL